MKPNQRKLNHWELAEAFKSSYPSLQYCTSSHSFYYYDASREIPIWVLFSTIDLRSLFIGWLKDTYPTDYKSFDISRFDRQIVLLLQAGNSFDMAEKEREAYSNGYLIPFKNGVLNVKTRELQVHHKDNMTRHIIPLDYIENQGKSLTDTRIGSFLMDISSQDAYKLNVLRATLHLILTNNLDYQVALYIYGPGGSGKTTFTNILQYLLGPDASITSSLSSLTHRFGSIKLKDKLLLVINELPKLISSESSILKSVIGGEAIEAEKKFGATSQIIPRVFVVITSNNMWEIKNTTSGFTRRWIYLPFLHIPTAKEMNLFKLKSNHTASGILLDDLPLLVSWVLSCPAEYLSYLNEGGEVVSAKVNPDSLISTNPLKVWAEECLEQAPGAKVNIGAGSTDDKTLYGSFISWTSKYSNEVGVVKASQFSFLLTLLLQNNLGWKVEKRRFSTGFSLIGVRLKDKIEKAPNCQLHSCYNKPLDLDIY